MSEDTQPDQPDTRCLGEKRGYDCDTCPYYHDCDDPYIPDEFLSRRDVRNEV